MFSVILAVERRKSFANIIPLCETTVICLTLKPGYCFLISEISFNNPNAEGNPKKNEQSKRVAPQSTMIFFVTVTKWR